MLGIIIGISSVILITSLGNGVKELISDQLSGIASNQIAIGSYETEEEYYITEEDIAYILENYPEIEAVSVEGNISGAATTTKGDFNVNIIGGNTKDYLFNNINDTPNPVPIATPANNFPNPFFFFILLPPFYFSFLKKFS